MSFLEKIEIIDKLIGGSPNRLREKFFINNNIELYNDIVSYTCDLDLTFKQRIWHWVNDKADYIYCEECNTNRVSFKMNWRDGYKTYCSNKCSSNNVELRVKTKETLLERYGVDHYSKTEDYINKVRQTSVERYGVDNYSKTEDYVFKSKRTYMERYGVDSYTKTEDYLEKTKKTCLEKYGVDSYIKTDEFKDRFKKTCLERYGSEHIYKSTLYRNSFNICNDIKENELLNFISNLYFGKVIQSYRDNFEIDIYLPDVKIGFEFNGLYYHSDKFKDKNYHLDKTNFFRERGIRIIHIWEDDWLYKRMIVESQIRNILLLNTSRIFARNCLVSEIKNPLVVRDFLNENHIQGNDRSIVNLGLYYNGDLVSIMTFNKSEGRKKMDEYGWNLSRFCNKINLNVIGGASKLLNFFIKVYNPNRIISYADKDWSLGMLYYKLNFLCINESLPDYKYVVKGIRRHKQNFTKSKLKLDNSVTESSYMSRNKINKVYDCGKIKFELLLNKKTH